MRKKSFFRAILSVLVILSMLASIPVFAEEASDEQQYTITEPYEYPVVPGTPEWEAFTDHQQMLDACQIPEQILTHLTTEALIDTVLSYPLMSDIYAYNEISEGFDTAKHRFNGLRELDNRPDALALLLERYESYPVINSRSRNVPNQNIFELSYYEMLLADKAYTLESGEDLGKIEDAVAEKYEQKKAEPNIYMLTAATYYEMLSEKQGVMPLATLVTVRTPGTATVDMLKYDADEAYISQDEILTLHREHDLIYSNAQEKGPVSKYYNCHSYAWYRQSTTNPYWLIDPSPYMGSSGGYVQFYPSFSNMPQSGYRVYYSNDDHSAYYTRTNSMPPSSLGVNILDFQVVTSKWGQGKLYEHKVNYCPYYSSESSLEYYRRG